MTDETDIELMRRVRAGDHDAFEVIVDRYKHQLVMIGSVALAFSASVVDDGKKVEKRVIVMSGDARFAGDLEGLKLEGSKRGFLGLSMVSLTDDLRDYFGVGKGSGVLVSEVASDGPAAKAGLKAGDVIVSIDGKAVDGPGTLSEAVREKKGGDQVKLDVRRRGASQQFYVTLDERALNRFEFRVPEVGKWMQRSADGRVEVFELEPGQSEALDRMRVFFESPELKSRVEKLRGDCSEYQERLVEIEQKMKALEKRLERLK